MGNLTESGRRKAEILEKNRQAQQDEGVEYAINRGARLSKYYVEAVCLPLFLLSMLAGQWIAVYAVATLYCTIDFGDFLGKYRFLRQKRYLVASVVFGVLAVGAAVLFLRDAGAYIGWWGA